MFIYFYYRYSQALSFQNIQYRRAMYWGINNGNVQWKTELACACVGICSYIPPPLLQYSSYTRESNYFWENKKDVLGPVHAYIGNVLAPGWRVSHVGLTFVINSNAHLYKGS